MGTSRARHQATGGAWSSSGRHQQSLSEERRRGAVSVSVEVEAVPPACELRYQARHIARTNNAAQRSRRAAIPSRSTPARVGAPGNDAGGG
jgi:hypothetical protein